MRLTGEAEGSYHLALVRTSGNIAKFSFRLAQVSEPTFQEIPCAVDLYFF